MTLWGDLFSLQQKTVNMWLAVPQVMATRLWMLANANPMQVGREQTEFNRMFSEKQTAFMDSVFAVNSQFLSSQQKLNQAVLESWQELIKGDSDAFAPIAKQIERETIKIFDKGISPYATAVSANRKRLSRKN